MTARRILWQPRRAWVVKTSGFDDLSVVIAKTEAGARGFTRLSMKEAGYCHGGHLERDDFEVFALPALDAWAKTAELRNSFRIDFAVSSAIEMAERSSEKIGAVKFMEGEYLDGRGVPGIRGWKPCMEHLLRKSRGRAAKAA